MGTSSSAGLEAAQAWPETLIVFRGDSDVAYSTVMQWIEVQAHLSYVTGLPRNAVLKQLAHEVEEQAKRAYERDGGVVYRQIYCAPRPRHLAS